MKLICVEEHVLDPALGAATRNLVAAEAPYLNNWGSRVVDGQHVKDRSRPHVVASSESANKALDLGALRIADMDTNGVTMQVLSYGGFPQLLPADKATDLCRAANDNWRPPRGPIRRVFPVLLIYRGRRPTPLRASLSVR